MDHLKATGSPSGEKVTEQKMDAALKAKWIDDLRSGNFKQVSGYLKGPDGYCCLGVLCESAELQIEGSNRVAGSDDMDNYSRLYDFISSGAMSRLVDMNDGQSDGSRKSFSEIADYIEQNL